MNIGSQQCNIMVNSRKLEEFDVEGESEDQACDINDFDSIPDTVLTGMID